MAGPCHGANRRKQDRDSAAPQPFLRRHIPGDGDSMFPPGRGQGQLPSTGHACVEGPKVTRVGGNEHCPGVHFSLPPPEASLDRGWTDPEAG